MGEYPSSRLVPLPTITPWSLESIGSGIISSGAAALHANASGTYPSANIAVLYPFYLQVPFTVRLMFAYNGATVSGTFCLGVYTLETSSPTILHRIITTGAVTQTGANSLQVVSVTATLLQPGNYFMAISCDNTTATFFRTTTPSTALSSVLGMRSVISSHPLPATLTTATVATTFVPVIGICSNSVI